MISFGAGATLKNNLKEHQITTIEYGLFTEIGLKNNLKEHQITTREFME